MLNKDEYNQEEYNDYYRQEIEGSELNGGEDEGGGMMSKLIALLVLLVLAIGGYFGYNAMNTSNENSVDSSLQVSVEPSLPQSVQEEAADEENEAAQSTEKVVEVEKNIQNSVTEEVAKAVSAKGKMSPEEVASIVAAVMQQMNEKTPTSSSSKPNAVKQDIELMDKLSDTEVDSVSEDLIKELEGVDISENTHVDNSKKQVDVYNKVNVQSVSGQDELSQLSNEINSVINEGIGNDKAANYTANITKEVATRQNEMRIIIVKKGDTLGKLAQRAYGNVMDYKKIYRANPEVTRPDRIYIGQKLRIPN